MASPEKISVQLSSLKINPFSGHWSDDSATADSIEYIRSDIVEQMVKAENERCAKIAEGFTCIAFNPGGLIAKAIRGDK